MKSKKILLTVLMIIMIIISNMKLVYAAESFSVSIASDKQNYAGGQTVEITVSLNNIVSDTGLYGVSGTLVYDTNVFETITSDAMGNTDSIIGLNSWTISYGSADNMFAGLTSSAAKTEQSIMKIKLKVKDGAPLGKTTIMIKNVAGASALSGDDITTTPASVSINVKDPSEVDDNEIPSIVVTPSPTIPTEQPTTQPTTTTTPIQVIKVTPTPTGNKLPQTGIQDYTVPALLGALIISLVSYIAYRRYKDI